MSMGISQLNHGSTDSLHSNSNQERGDIVSPKYEKRSVYESSRASFDPVRCDQDVPVNKIMQLEDGFRRHSIANMNNTPFDPKSFPYAIYSAPSSPRHPPYDSTDHFVPYQCLPSPIKRQNQHTPYIKDRSRRESYGSRRSSRVYFDESDMKDLFVSRSDHEGVYRRPSEVQSDSQFSRSPELKIMHKLAERKRRKEMRDLFDELKDTLPVDKYSKTSKWEILTKAVEYINALKKNDYAMEQELLSLRYELSNVKNN
ncbi:hypothetical protein BDB01DRAFT_804770 [Pilobolus umbonatus]|nr:hypothetical protein BDB01DRAFT_804770 [Pilobolus umbonatus]